MYSLLDDDTLLEMILEFFCEEHKGAENLPHSCDIKYMCDRSLMEETEESARKFWEEYLLYMNPSIPIPSLSFSDVYDVFGGHIYDLEQCYLC